MSPEMARCPSFPPFSSAVDRWQDVCSRKLLRPLALNTTVLSRWRSIKASSKLWKPCSLIDCSHGAPTRYSHCSSCIWRCVHRALRVLDTGACLLAALLVMGYYLAIPGGPAHRSRFQASRNGAEAVESRRFTILLRARYTSIPSFSKTARTRRNVTNSGIGKGKPPTMIVGAYFWSEE